MAESPENSPPAPENPSAASPSNGFSPPSPEISSSAPPTYNGSASSSPPAPSQDYSPPPSIGAPPPQRPQNSQPPPSGGSPAPVNSQPPPSGGSPTPENSQPPPPGGSSPGTPPAPESPANQYPPQSPPNQTPPLAPSPPSQGSNDEQNKNKDQNGNGGNSNNGNNSNRDVVSPPPPPGNRNSSGHSPSPPRSLGPPRNDGGSESGDNNSPNIPGIIGVAAGAGVLLLFLILLCICCMKKKSRKQKFDHVGHYNNNNNALGGGTGGGGYYNNVHSPQEQYGRNNHVVNLAATEGGRNNNSDSFDFTGRDGPPLPSPVPSMVLGFNKSSFAYEELALATQGFSDSNLLGQGGFGYVHKGILGNGKEVAVKSLKVGSGQGEREFQAEVEIISRVHHRHLVSLVGYCISGGQRLLVYEFLPNNTLEFHLHGKDRPVMEWSIRMKIALGSARGLAYLHEDCHPRIIHRDIKAANILLDFSFETKVADFGLAKLSQDNNTHVSTRVMGTFGYLAPEYASSGKLSEKSDVYSFGVMLLELVTGRPPVDLTGEMEDSLVDWARPLCLKAAQDGDYSELADPRLEGNYDKQEMGRMAACAVAAIRHSARRRPMMSQIVRALEGNLSMNDITEGVKPAGQSTYLSPGNASSDYDASSYSADMRKFRKLALESKEYQSSEPGVTSEYGLNPSASTSEEMH